MKKKKDRTKRMIIEGMPIEHVVNIDPICTYSGLTYSHFMRLMTEEFLERVRHYQGMLDRCEPLELKHDLARYAALCVHTWDERPMEQYIKDNALHEDDRIGWTWEPEIVTPAKPKEKK